MMISLQQQLLLVLVRIFQELKLLYLGVTLDCTLSFCEHLKKTAAKVGTRNNLLGMLAGSSWGAAAQTLRTAALALCYSAAEYCAPVRSRSPYVRLVDNSSMKPCVPFWEHFVLPHSHGYRYSVTLHLLIFPGRKQQQKLLAKIRINDSLPLHSDIKNHPPAPSRHPLWLDVPREEMTALDEWCDEWLGANAINQPILG